MDEAIENLHGPILVFGASGFVGASLFKKLLEIRPDVYGTVQNMPAWRLTNVNSEKIILCDLLARGRAEELIREINPKTIFDCVAFGGYSFQQNSEQIYLTNFNLLTRILQTAKEVGVRAIVHSGSSSEYGLNAAGPSEDAALIPNSEYAVSKVAGSHLVTYYGKCLQLPVVNMRLYSVYGPEEDSSRLIPHLVKHALEKSLPPFVDKRVGRDLVYIDDVVDALVHVAGTLRKEFYGESFNIGTGKCTKIGELADLTKQLFDVDVEPVFSMSSKKWDVSDWYANTKKTSDLLGWHAATDLPTGLLKTFNWYKGLADKEAYLRSTKKEQFDFKHSVSAIVACYNDGQAIPVMYQRLTALFKKLRLDYEIIFVNDGSPDDSEEIIRELSGRDFRVVGISHARNFGSQSAFRSGMKFARKNAVVIMDGDLQDPPELIEQFVEKWREGYEVVYGRRIKRQAPLLMQVAYKLFYRAFSYFSYIKIPRDAGDFSLIDRQAADWLTRFPEKDMFLRGLRAYIGFKQIGVDYVRPERMFGRSTNNFFKNIGWAKKGILSFTKAPLNFLSSISVILFTISIFMGLFQILFRIYAPELTPKGFTTVLLLIVGFGSLNLFGIGILGEYIAKILEEAKNRPHFIQRAIISQGECKKVSATTAHSQIEY